MRSLSDLQSLFSQALVGHAEFALLDALQEPSDVAGRRLGAYRRNVWGNWRMALRSTYPVVAALLGDNTFDDLCDHYIRVCPSTNGDLNEYGDSFPDFLCHHSISGKYDYLPDVARVEYQLLQSYNAKDPKQFDFWALARIPREQHSAVVLEQWECARLLTLTSPADEIWKAHQLDRYQRDKALESIRFSGRTRHVLCSRTRDGVLYLKELDDNQTFIWQSISSNATLGELMAQSRDLRKLPRLVSKWAALGLLTGFRVRSVVEAGCARVSSASIGAEWQITPTLAQL